jgi:hypothetical protein
MKQTLVAYCDGMDENGLDALAADVQRGGLAWFPDEFASLIRAGALTPRHWEYFTNVMVDDDDVDQLDEYLRTVWSKAAPERPYPLDEPAP